MNYPLSQTFRESRERILSSLTCYVYETEHNTANEVPVSVLLCQNIMDSSFICGTDFFLNTSSLMTQKPEGKRPLRRPRHRWKNSIRIDEMGWAGVEWMHLSQEKDHWWAVVNTVMNPWVP
jgi:hypothetical protein